MRPAQSPRPRGRPIPAHTSVNDELVEAIARRVVALLVAEPVPVAPAPTALVDTTTLARLLGVSADTVRRHADELGARAVGGERGRGRRLLFDVEVARAAWATSCLTSNRSQGDESPADTGRKARRRPRATGSGTDLLPIRGQEARR